MANLNCVREFYSQDFACVTKCFCAQIVSSALSCLLPLRVRFTSPDWVIIFFTNRLQLILPYILMNSQHALDHKILKIILLSIIRSISSQTWFCGLIWYLMAQLQYRNLFEGGRQFLPQQCISGHYFCSSFLHCEKDSPLHRNKIPLQQSVGFGT